MHLSEDDVARLLTPADAVAAVEACFERMARGAVENRPRYRLGLDHGAMAVMAAADLELGYAGAKVYVGFAAGARFEVLLFRANEPELVAVIDADKLGQLRTGAASGVAAKHLARSEAATLGVSGCGWQAAGTPASRAPPAATSTSTSRSPRTTASSARATTSSRCSTCRSRGPRWGRR